MKKILAVLDRIVDRIMCAHRSTSTNEQGETRCIECDQIVRRSNCQQEDRQNMIIAVALFLAYLIFIFVLYLTFPPMYP